MSRDLHEQHSQSDPIILTSEERTELESPARSTKTSRLGREINEEEAEHFIEQAEDPLEPIA